MKISMNWLREFVDLPETPEELRPTLDDLGLVVEGVRHVGEGLEDVVVARVEEIRAIPGADRVRLVVVESGAGPLEIVCGATNFSVGQHVPLAPVGAVLPGGFVIAERTMRGVTSHGMLCSSRELELSDDHQGLMVLDDLIEPRVGEPLIAALSMSPDVIFDISVEGNRPDAWSVEGVARDLATRLGRELRAPAIASPNSEVASSTVARAGIDAPDLCGRLTVSVLQQVVVGPSPAWVAQRLANAGVRPISNVVDASNFVMLELGQPTHPYDAAAVADGTLRARRARPGEVLETLDGVERALATKGRGLGDTGEDCVIVDGRDVVLGLAGLMGGAASEITADTTDVLLEAAYFEPMSIARSSKRHGLRSEASHRFERGVDPELGLRAAGRFVEILRESVPNLVWLATPLDVRGDVPEPSTVSLRPEDVSVLLGAAIDPLESATLLRGLGFTVTDREDCLEVTAPTNRPDVRRGTRGRADVIEEIARLHSYRRLPRHTPTWTEPGGLSARQRLRRRLRGVVVGAGALEAWTATLGSDADFDLLHPGVARVRITNPLATGEDVLRATMLTGLVRAWSRNDDRGLGEVMLAEFGVVFRHPDLEREPRWSKGGNGGDSRLALPSENERLTVVLARPGDDARAAVALWGLIAARLGLADVVVRSTSELPAGLHPSRSGALVDRATGAVLGYVGEVDATLVVALRSSPAPRRLGVVDLDLDALADEAKATRATPFVRVPSRFPSAVIDLALVTPNRVNASDLAYALRMASDLVESVTLFDVYHETTFGDARSLAFTVRFGSMDRTIAEDELGELRRTLIEAATITGASLR